MCYKSVLNQLISNTFAGLCDALTEIIFTERVNMYCLLSLYEIRTFYLLSNKMECNLNRYSQPLIFRENR